MNTGRMLKAHNSSYKIKVNLVSVLAFVLSAVLRVVSASVFVMVCKKKKKKEGEGSARLGRAAKDAYQYSECTLSKSASPPLGPAARLSLCTHADRAPCSSLCPQINTNPTAAMVFFSRFLYGF